ncbi:MAG: carbon monoxide dehydrogenase accessory protein CooC [Dehalococcoidales bacterium]|jgi:CO dehydrogenase maturation factor|nr:carbon monoxide dehydrogenase accessory protein CooC [Dehalococcoidales bacterium]
MKIAISGKGGVGKTLLASLLAQTFNKSGYRVIAIDADPDANLAVTLGLPDAGKVTPISEMKELIEERTETQPGKSNPYFKLNPRVDDIPNRYSLKHNGIRLLVMGPLKKGGSGCYCPENALLVALLAHLLVARDEVVVLDMAAGIEHLSRGTARAVDKLIVVVEPGRNSLETAHRIARLAKDIGLENIAVVGNKVHNQKEREFITSGLTGFELLGFIPYDQTMMDADVSGKSLVNASPSITSAVNDIYQKLMIAVKT